MKQVCLIFFFVFPLISFSQELLVNGDFEEENICTEYQVNCAPEGWISSSSGFSNYIRTGALAYSGGHCMIIEAGKTRNKFQRTYVRTQLLCQLRAGKQYQLTFYAKSGNNILDSAGIYFTSNDFLFDKTPLYKVTPSVFLTDAVTIDRRDTNWQKISFKYTAKGREKFLTIANFSRRDINGETNVPLENHFYIFVDEFSLTPVDPDEKICPDWEKAKLAIYELNDRHEYLDRTIKFYRTQNRLPPEPALSMTKIVRADTLTLPDVLFGTGKYKLQTASFAILDSFCRTLINRQVDSLVIEGHTDSTGDKNANTALSLQRATAVSDYIRNKPSLDSLPFRTRNWGPLKPVATNRTPAGRSKNRRVEILLYIRE